MGLTAAGMTAVLDGSGPWYAAVGDGPGVGDQTSDARVPWGWSVTDGVVSALDLPYTFTGAPGGAVTHLLVFSAASGGAFYGSVALAASAFGSTGRYRITALTLAGAPGSALAPIAPYALGTEVGVPTGTVLTPSLGTGTNDGTEQITLVHPVSGDEAVIEATLFQSRSWDGVLTINPGPGQTFLFDSCSFTAEAANWVVEVIEDNGVPDQMQPLVVFRNCTFEGQSSSGRALLGPYTWVIDSHLAGAADGWQGGVYAVGIGSNIIGGDDGGPDPHADGWQITGAGHSTVYRCFVSAGTGPGASSALRVGTEFSAVTDVQVHYCGLDRGGYPLQMGGAADKLITGVSVVGNRWTRTDGFGPADLVFVELDEWTDNAYVDGEPIESPV